MARLPSDTELGGLPSAHSNRPIAQIDASPIAQGVARLGAGVANLGQEVGRYADKVASEDLQIGGARADADFLTKKIEFEKQFNDSDQDYQNWNKRYETGINQIAAQAAGNISDPRVREVWMQKRRDDIARGVAGIEQKALKRTNDSYLTTGLEVLDNLQRTYVNATDDEGMRTEVIKAGHGVVEDLRARGIIDDSKAYQFRQQWVRNAAEATLMSLKPEDRIDALGGRVTGIEGVVNRIIGVESGGNANAANPNSSARGLGQFIDATWLDMVTRYRPDLAQGQSPAQIIAMKSNPQLSREMTTRYTEENAGKLKAVGVEATPGNLYLAHFLGPDAAPAVAKADANAPISDYVPAAAIAANKSILAGKTVGEVRAWAERKMGGAGSRADLAEFIDPDKRRVMMEKAQGEVLANRREVAAQEEFSRKQWVDGLQFDASKGKVTLEEIDQDFKNGRFKSFEEYNSVKAQIDKYQKDGASLDAVLSVLNNPNGVFNPRDPEHKDGLATLDERTGLTEAMTKGDPVAASRASQLFERTGAVPDKQKGFLESSIRSGNPQQLEYALSVLDLMDRRNPGAFLNAFGKETFNTLQSWRAQIDRDPKRFYEEARRSMDPSMQKATDEREKTARDVIKKMSDTEILDKFDSSWIPFVGTPDAPVNADRYPGVGILREEYADAFAEGYGKTGDEKQAHEYAGRVVKMTWADSKLGGGRLMKYAPETLLPPINGGFKPYQKQLEDGLRDRMGNPTNMFGFAATPKYALVPMPETKAEIDALRAGRTLAGGRQSPAWSVLVMNPETQIWEPKGSFYFDVKKVQDENMSGLTERDAQARARLDETERSTMERATAATDPSNPLRFK